MRNVTEPCEPNTIDCNRDGSRKRRARMPVVSEPYADPVNEPVQLEGYF